MRKMKKLPIAVNIRSINTIVIILASTLNACSFVSLNPQAQDVTVLANPATLRNCKFLANTTVSLWSKAETFQKQETVENQLNTLARNEAAKIGGNTVIANSNIINGQRNYQVYSCPTPANMPD